MPTLVRRTSAMQRSGKGEEARSRAQTPVGDPSRKRNKPQGSKASTTTSGAYVTENPYQKPGGAVLAAVTAKMCARRSGLDQGETVEFNVNGFTSEDLMLTADRCAVLGFHVAVKSEKLVSKSGDAEVKTKVLTLRKFTEQEYVAVYAKLSAAKRAWLDQVRLRMANMAIPSR